MTHRRSHRLAVCVASAAMLLAACTGSAPAASVNATSTTAVPSRPATTTPTDRTTAGTPDTAMAEVQAGTAPVTGLVVVHDGMVVGEAYAPTSGPDVRQPVWSVTKSVVSTLVGIAVADGDLRLDTTMADLFGDAAAAHPDLTVEDLLTMTSGLDVPDGDATFGALYRADDWVTHVLDQPTVAAPGTDFAYCSACAHLLTAALGRATGTDVGSWAQSRLFDPLDVADVDWERATDGSAIPIGGWGLQLTARELARFGQLHLDRGMVDGEPVVPTDWVEAATTTHVAAIEPFEAWQLGYGYLWWLAADGYAATGRGGQLVLVLPDDDVVVAVTADLSDAEAVRATDFVWDRVVAPLTGD